MTSVIASSTARGQITIPKEWRSQWKTDHYFLKLKNNTIIVRPINMEDLEEEVIFDAERDNEGKGVDVKDVMKLLKKYHG